MADETFKMVDLASTGADAEGWVSFQLAEVPWRVGVQIEEVGGRPEIVGLRLQPHALITVNGDVWTEPAVVSADALRRLPLREIRTAALHVINGDRQKAGGALDRRHDDRRPGEPWGDDHYRAVADEYRSAVASGNPPLVTIGQRWHVGRAMASKYVQEARVRGHLGWPARRGMAGASETKSPVPSNKKQRRVR